MGNETTNQKRVSNRASFLPMIIKLTRKQAVEMLTGYFVSILPSTVLNVGPLGIEIEEEEKPNTTNTQCLSYQEFIHMYEDRFGVQNEDVSGTDKVVPRVKYIRELFPWVGLVAAKQLAERWVHYKAWMKRECRLPFSVTLYIN